MCVTDEGMKHLAHICVLSVWGISCRSHHLALRLLLLDVLVVVLEILR